jgi:hypothetical protein
MEAEAIVLYKYKQYKNLNDKEYSFLLSTCCIKSKVQSVIRKHAEKENVNLELDSIFNPILKYKDIANKLDENIDLSLLSFEIFEKFPVHDENTFEMIEEGLSFPMVILELERIEKEEEYGLDDQKFFFCVSKKNEWKNYIPIQTQTWLSLPEFLKIYSLSELFEVNHSLKLEEELLSAEKEFLKDEIIRTTSRLEDLKERWNKLEITGKLS